MNERYQDSIASHFSESADNIIMKSPSDMGVRRNFGRNGARFAPDAIEACFKKMTHHLDSKSFRSVVVSSHTDELRDYDAAMSQSSKEITKALSSGKSFVHLGGGHDHALPLLKALDGTDCENILVVNFDAHCDTRVDSRSHSGTPFRDFDQAAKKPFHLIQVGIHEFANNDKTLSKLSRNAQTIWPKETAYELIDSESFVDAIFETCPFEITEKTALFISLDCDALSSSVMSAVSAVNHDGLDTELVSYWIETLRDFPCERKVFGIYEYNPIFEDLSQKGARYLAGLMYKYFKSSK